MSVHSGRLAEIADEERTDPPYLYPDYRSTERRAPRSPLLIIPHTVSETTGPAFGESAVEEFDADLTRRHPAPLDPNFSGAGRCLTDDDGRYRFVTIKPGAYPWGNHPNAWRPQHIHFSLFGRAFTERLVTQMYFPGDPLLEFDPIFQSVRDAAAQKLLISSFDWETTTPDWCLGYRFDIVLGGRAATPLERR